MTSKIAPRYAKALFSCGSTEEEKLMHSQALRTLTKEIKHHPEVLSFFQNPFMPIEKKTETLKKGLRTNADPRLMAFLEILIKSKHFKDLQGISHEFQTLLNESRKTDEATLIFAEKMDDATLEVFKGKLETIFQKKMEIREKVDPAILGGFILISAGKIIDLSLKGKLNSFKERFYSQKV